MVNGCPGHKVSMEGSNERLDHSRGICMWQWDLWLWREWNGMKESNSIESTITWNSIFALTCILIFYYRCLKCFYRVGRKINGKTKKRSEKLRKWNFKSRQRSSTGSKVLRKYQNGKYWHERSMENVMEKQQCSTTQSSLYGMEVGNEQKVND